MFHKKWSYSRWILRAFLRLLLFFFLASSGLDLSMWLGLVLLADPFTLQELINFIYLVVATQCYPADFFIYLHMRSSGITICYVPLPTSWLATTPLENIMNRRFLYALFRWLIHVSTICDPWSVNSIPDDFIIKIDMCIYWYRGWGFLPV
jgi:hypothetical protein